MKKLLVWAIVLMICFGFTASAAAIEETVFGSLFIKKEKGKAKKGRRGQFIQYILPAPSFQGFRVQSTIPFHSRRSRINGLGTHTKLFGKYPATLSQIMHVIY